MLPGIYVLGSSHHKPSMANLCNQWCDIVQVTVLFLTLDQKEIPAQILPSQSFTLGEVSCHILKLLRKSFGEVPGRR